MEGFPQPSPPPLSPTQSFSLAAPNLGCSGGRAERAWHWWTMKDSQEPPLATMGTRQRVVWSPCPWGKCLPPLPRQPLSEASRKERPKLLVSSFSSKRGPIQSCIATDSSAAGSPWRVENPYNFSSYGTIRRLYGRHRICLQARSQRHMGG